MQRSFAVDIVLISDWQKPIKNPILIWYDTKKHPFHFKTEFEFQKWTSQFVVVHLKRELCFWQQAGQSDRCPQKIKEDIYE